MKRFTQHIKKAILSAGMLLVFIASMQAGEGDNTLGMSQQISNQLSFPGELIQPSFNEKVKVDFRMKADGSVEVIRVHTNNTDLKTHVAKQFSKLHFSEKNIDTEKVYRIEVKYRVI